MSDNTKSCLAMFMLLAAFVLPIVAFAVGMAVYDFRTAVILAGIVFTVLFVVAGILIVLVRDMGCLTWVAIAMPVLLSLIYGVMPDAIPGPIDDLVVIIASMALSALLASPKVPQWLANLLKNRQAGDVIDHNTPSKDS